MLSSWKFVALQHENKKKTEPKMKKNRPSWQSKENAFKIMFVSEENNVAKATTLYCWGEVINYKIIKGNNNLK